MMINEEWVKIEKKGGKLFVEISLPLYTIQNKVVKTKYTTSHIRSYVESLGHKIIGCSEDPYSVHNSLPSQRTKTWVFDLKTRQQNKSNSKRKNQQKSKKSLDKSSESVIMNIEKKDSFSKNTNRD